MALVPKSKLRCPLVSGSASANGYARKPIPTGSVETGSVFSCPTMTALQPLARLRSLTPPLLNSCCPGEGLALALRLSSQRSLSSTIHADRYDLTSTTMTYLERNLSYAQAMLSHLVCRLLLEKKNRSSEFFTVGLPLASSL